MPLIFRAAIKPTPSIAKAQRSVSLRDMTERELKIGGRHDPCIAPRAVPWSRPPRLSHFLTRCWRMNMNDELNALRREIDGIDAELVTLLKRRMAAAAE